MPVRPHLDETTRSYIRRINSANALQHGELMLALRRDRRRWVYYLSEWTQTEPEILLLAMPQLAGPHPEPGLRQKLVGRPVHKIHAPACHHCTLARGAGTFVEVYTTQECVLCPKHALWIGEGVGGTGDQFSVHDCPDIVMAWRHHKNLIARYGRSHVRKAFEASNVINWRWQEQFLHFTAAAETYDRLAAALPRQANSQALVAAALYTSVVILTAVIASRHSRRIACSPHPEAFLDRVRDQITDGWKPQGALDPLRHWMESSRASGNLGSDTIHPSNPR